MLRTKGIFFSIITSMKASSLSGCDGQNNEPKEIYSVKADQHVMGSSKDAGSHIT